MGHSRALVAPSQVSPTIAVCRGDDRGSSPAAVPGTQASGTPTIHALPPLEPMVIALVNAYEDAEAGRGSVWPLPPRRRK